MADCGIRHLLSMLHSSGLAEHSAVRFLRQPVFPRAESVGRSCGRQAWVSAEQLVGQVRRIRADSARA